MELMFEALGATLLLAAGIFLLFIIFFLVCQCKIFSKAGEAWWKGIIPIYSIYVNYKLCGIPTWAFILYIIFLLPIKSIAMISAVGLFILSIYSLYRLSKVFGHGIGFTVGLVLLPFIFYPILAFGKSEYECDF